MIRDRKRALSERFGYPPDQVDLHFDLYDAQIGYQDAQLRRLFEALRERGEERRTLWVVTADHGEGMGDHGYWGHGTRVYDEQVRVPLIFFGGRGRWPAGVAEGLTRHVDLLPTLAELLGVSLDLDALRIEGSSVARWLDDPGARLPARIVLSETRPLGKYRRAIGQRDAMRISARDARYKYIHNEGRPDEFYDLESDPGELSDLVRQPSARRDRLRTWLFSRWAQLGEDARSDDSRLDLSVEQIELLEKLGYL